MRRPLQSESVRIKAVETNRERYGADYAVQTEETQAKRKETNLARYGVEYPSQNEDVKTKTRETNIERYGAEHFMQTDNGIARHREVMQQNHGEENPMKVPAIRKQVLETNIRLFGGPSPFSSPEVQAKARATMLERHGQDNYAKTDEFLTKLRITCLERYGSESYLSSDKNRKRLKERSQELYGVDEHWLAPEVQEKIKTTMFERYGVTHPMQLPEVVKRVFEAREKTLNDGSSHYRAISKPNLRLAEAIESEFGVKVRFEHLIAGQTFDIYVESANLLIEINPTVSHNSHTPFGCLISSCDSKCVKHKRLANNYHYKRAEIAKAHGLSLVQIYDWNNQEDILRLLSGKLEKGWRRVSARKLKTCVVRGAEAKAFLHANHIQGSLQSQTHCYGLRDEAGQLLAVATFGAARFGAKEEFEFLRYAVKRGVLIHGGSGKLWKNFLDQVKPVSVISYVDYNHTTAPNLFLNGLGFHEDKTTGPALNWHSIRSNKRVPQTSLLRLGADRLLGTTYGSREESGLNNEDIMLLEGFLPVYTAGNRVFRWAAMPTVPAQ